MNSLETQTPYHGITIAKALQLIEEDRLVLPLLQRPLVWETDRFVKLYDSILQGYPINAMLFWGLPRDMNSKGRFYRFIRQFTKFPGTPADPNQRKLNEPLPQGPIKNGTLAVLDGQQRLSSFYMGLMGTYADRVFYGGRKLERNYPPLSLYLCITHKMPEKEGLDLQPYYQLTWLPKNTTFHVNLEAGEASETWLRISEVMSAGEMEAEKWARVTAQKACDEANAHGHRWQMEANAEDELLNETTFATMTLLRLHEAIHVKPYIHYYLDQSDDLARAVAVFVRVNSGGMELGHSDLVFSVMSCEWETLNAKDEIAGLKNELEKITLGCFLDGIHLDERFILRTAMLLTVGKVLPFDLSQMKSSILKGMEDGWSYIRSSIVQSCQILCECNPYCFRIREIVMILAFYLHRCHLIEYTPTSCDIAAMKQWLLRAASTWQDAKAAADTKLKRYAKALQESMDGGSTHFPFNDMITKGWVSLVVHREGYPSHPEQDGIFIEKLLDKPKAASRFLLGLIQYGLEPSIWYDIDHCYPSSEAWTPPINLSLQEYAKYKQQMDSLVNLQLLHYSNNRSKNKTPFDIWFAGLPVDEQTKIRQNHLIPTGHPVPLKDFSAVQEAFKKFYEDRRKLLLHRLNEIFADPPKG